VKKTAAVMLGIMLMMLFACGDDPAEPENGNGDPASPYSGTFQIEYELVSNDCVVPAPPSAFTTVTVRGDSIWFGSFPGVWDESTLTGTGDTPEYTVPVLPPDCYSYYTVVYEITYVTADSFSGTYGSDFRKDAECPNPDPCSFRYNITGSR
jgi:hypothetical protein